MKKDRNIYLSCLCCLLLLTGNVFAQVSHGGSPLPFSTLRNTNDPLFEEMPSFDLQETLRMDSLNESDLRSGYHFAYKFMTDFDRYNSGIRFTLPDGTRVWRLGIYSPNALSINILFSKYRIPEGGQVFVYDESQTRILGAFNHLNNSDLNVLPIAPIAGERIIVEYQEPANVAFPGELTVGEVNHGYRDLRNREPNEGSASIQKIPALACFDDGENAFKQWGQSVVLLIIDGTTGCTGSLINNSENDGKPYLLTASHCLNDQFLIKNPDYAKIASSIVCFYNYDSPFCDPILRGSEELSTASSYFRAANEKADMALLELTETPPAYYRPYYAGWNIEETGSNAPYTCIQHPNYSTKRVSLTEGELTPYTYRYLDIDFYKDGHWHVEKWDIGYTAGGSSGSPLFNPKGEIVGALTGGQSFASDPTHDYFYNLGKAWEPTETIDKSERQLKHWLDPTGEARKSCPGLDPYQSSPCFRLSNVHTSGKQEQAECALYPGSTSDFLFGDNANEITEYAEHYTVAGESTLYGAYFVTPASGYSFKDMEIEVRVYDGNGSSPTLLYSRMFKPTYCSKSNLDGTFTENIKSLDRAQESFIAFERPVLVDNQFLISYKLKKMPTDSHFAVYHLPKGESARNTAWVLNKGKWEPANEFTPIGFSTSLFIDPVIKYGNTVDNETIRPNDSILIHAGTERGKIYVVLPPTASNATYQLSTAQGKTIACGPITERHTRLDFSDQPTGIFFLTIHTKNKHYTEKIIF